MLLWWKMENDDSAASLKKEARRMKPWARRHLEWRYGPMRSHDVEPQVDAHADWTPLGRHWRARALFAWLLILLGLAVWLGVFTFLVMHMTGFERWGDPYWYGSMAWCGLPSLYAAGRIRDRRKRLKPSPFFFWFDR